MRRVYLDANVLIAMVERRDDRSDALRWLFAFANDARPLELVTSELSFVECLVGVLRNGPPETVLEYRELRISGALTVLPLEWPVLEDAARLRATHRELKLADAIHVSAALATRCDALLTEDLGLRPEYTEPTNEQGAGWTLAVVQPHDRRLTPYLGSLA